MLKAILSLTEPKALYFSNLAKILESPIFKETRGVFPISFDMFVSKAGIPP
jgi:hypothetical protein